MRGWGKGFKALDEFFVGAIGGEWDGDGGEGPSFGAAPEDAGGDVATDDGPGFYDCCFADVDAREDDAVGTDECAGADGHAFVAAGASARAPMEVSDDGAADADGAVIADGDRLGVNLIEIDHLANPDPAANMHTAPALEHRAKIVTAGGDQGESSHEPL